MSEQRMTKSNGYITHWIEYNEEEIQMFWDTKGQGHHEAVHRGGWCVVIPCDLNQAIKYSLWFVHKAFAIPTCTHYNGETLSLYCGDAGSGASNLKSRVEAFIEGANSETVASRKE